MTLLRELIFDILSYLPVKSLLRFKCVSKHWNDITQDFQFICLHYKHGPVIYNHINPPQKQNTTIKATAGEDEFKLLHSRGLLLEYANRPSHFTTHSSNLRYRIRNPEIQPDQILEIPDSQSLILNMCIVFDPDYKVLKLLSFVYDDDSGSNSRGYEVLDLGNEGSSSYYWRQIHLPQQIRGETRMCNQVKKHSKQIKVLFAMGIAYSMWDTEANSHIGIDILDMVNDSYINHTTFPMSFYTKNDSILWNGKLSFAKIVKDEIHVMVLDYVYKKHVKWSDRKLVIKLAFMREFSVAQEQIKLVQVHESKLWFWWNHKGTILLCTYDITTGKVNAANYNGELISFIKRPCLLAFKGMNAEVAFSQ